jgi:hypothetical protein
MAHGLSYFPNEYKVLKRRRQCGSKAIVWTCRVDFLGQIERFMLGGEPAKPIRCCTSGAV